MSKVYGIDLGTRALKIYKKNDGVIYDAKNILAIKDNSTIIAIGDEAFEMYGKAPSNIEVTYPVKYGVIADIKNMQALLNLVFDEIGKTRVSLTAPSSSSLRPRTSLRLRRRLLSTWLPIRTQSPAR